MGLGIEDGFGLIGGVSLVEHGVILYLAVFLQQRVAGGVANASGIVRTEVERAKDIDGDLAIEAKSG